MFLKHFAFTIEKCILKKLHFLNFRQTFINNKKEKNENKSNFINPQINIMDKQI